MIRGNMFTENEWDCQREQFSIGFMGLKELRGLCSTVDANKNKVGRRMRQDTQALKNRTLWERSGNLASARRANLNQNGKHGTSSFWFKKDCVAFPAMTTQLTTSAPWKPRAGKRYRQKWSLGWRLLSLMPRNCQKKYHNSVALGLSPSRQFRNFRRHLGRPNL